MQPFVKWAGGKRQLLPKIMDKLPETYNTYFEPFLGGGALLFVSEPKNAVVGDVNRVLIDTYNQIKHDVSSLMEILNRFSEEHNAVEDKKEYYYKMRENYNSKIKNGEYDLMTVSLFLYLNKTCFNGLYRVNAKGLFNVPFNNRKTLNIYSKENLEDIAKYLNNITIKNGDFEDTCKNAKKGDFVFFDSPYAPLKSDSFESYTKEGFAKEEHIRLANLFRKLSDRGVYCMLTNHNTDLIDELYEGYYKEVVQVKRMINSDAKNRVGEEVIITNYKI